MDPGALSKSTNELGKSRGSRLAQIEYPEIGSLERRDPGDAARYEADRISGRHSGGKLRAHDAPPMRPATTGAILSTSTATPFSFGWRPSGWLSSGFIATPSRKNG